MKKNSQVKRIVDSKAFCIVLALLLSVAIWVYVSSMETDEYRITFRNVPLELVGASALRDTKNLEITDVDVSYVTVEVSGPRRIVGSLSSTDLVAQVDVSKLSRASYASQQYSIVFPDGVDTGKVSVVRKSPEIVNFMVSGVIEKTIQVKGVFEGTVAEGYIQQKAEFNPSTVTVYGPEVYLKDIEYAWVTFGNEDEVIDKSYSAESVFKLMDADGEECDMSGLQLSTDTVASTLPILEVRNIPLSVNVNYGAGANEENTQITIEPQYITLSGDSAVLNEYNSISLGLVDTTKFAASSEEMTYSIIFDNSLNNITGITQATVKVSIAGLSTKTIDVTNIQMGNIPSGFTAMLNAEQVQISVVIRGPEQELSAIDESNVRAVVDWSDFNGTLGTQELPAVIKIDADGVSKCGAIYDCIVSVVVGKAS